MADLRVSASTSSIVTSKGETSPRQSRSASKVKKAFHKAPVRKRTYTPENAVPAPVVLKIIHEPSIERPKTQSRVLSYGFAFSATPLERIAMIRRGILASEAKQLFAVLLGPSAALKALNLSPATVNKKAKLGGTLSPGESERVVGIMRLLGQVETMVQESGDPTGFDAPAWLTRWLTDPLPAFGGIRPADLVDTMVGQDMVSAALSRIQSGAYA